MPGNGYIKLYRKTLGSRVFANEGLLKVWVWCLLKANHEKRWVSVKTGRGVKEVEINPGQFIFGRNQAAKELSMKPSTVRNRIKKLKNMRNLDTQEDNQYTIIIIRNWGSYQGQKIKEDNQEDNERTTKGQRKDTNKNVKNVKNIFKPPKIEEVRAYCLERNNGINPKLWWDSYQAKGWMIGKNKMKDWKAAVRTWEHNQKSSDQPPLERLT